METIPKEKIALSAKYEKDVQEWLAKGNCITQAQNIGQAKSEAPNHKHQQKLKNDAAERRAIQMPVLKAVRRKFGSQTYALRVLEKLDFPMTRQRLVSICNGKSTIHDVRMWDRIKAACEELLKDD